MPEASPPPLEGRSIAILQTRHRKVLAQLIRRLGGRPQLAPCLREVRVEDGAPLREALERVAAEPVDLAVFQTGVGVAALHDDAVREGMERVLAERLAAATVAARGPKPLSALLRRGVRVDLRTHEPHTTEELLSLLRPVLGDGDLGGYRTLVQHYGAPNERLIAFLQERGAEVIEAFSYRWALPANLAPVRRCLRLLEAGELDAVLVTSAAQVENLYLAAERFEVAHLLTGWLREGTVVAAIGPTTAQALREHGIVPAVQPSRPKMVPLVEALAGHLAPVGGAPSR